MSDGGGRRPVPAGAAPTSDVGTRIPLEQLRGRYPKGAVETAIATLEAVRPDYPDGGAIRWSVDDALDRLYRFREIETGQKHPYRDVPNA